MAVHNESITVASVAKAHDAEITFLGTIGTQQAESDQLVHKLHSKTIHLVCVDEAGSCGDWLSCDLMSEAQCRDTLLCVPPFAREPYLGYISPIRYTVYTGPLAEERPPILDHADNVQATARPLSSATARRAYLWWPRRSGQTWCNDSLLRTRHQRYFPC